MLFQRPDDDTLYDALIARDAAYDGFAYVGVRTTGIFCRLTCAARKPKRENVQFFDTTAECLHAGFRPCLRCRPMMGSGEPEPLVAALIDAPVLIPAAVFAPQSQGCLARRRPGCVARPCSGPTGSKRRSGR
jgi:methylphosphotriester-DNA--protein-cysteine methyltransferase